MHGPLKGIRVLDLSRVLSGPFATMQLADLGADVWKVEPKLGDPSRDLSPPLIDGESAYYQSVNRNKRSLCLDFRHDRAGLLLMRLAERVDVVIENFLPKVKMDLGIGYDAVRRRNPGVVFCSISGFGQSGPYADRPGLDNIFQGMSGLMAVTGLDERPVKCGERIGDMVAGLNAAFAITAALFARSRSGDGVGQYIDLALIDCLVALQAPQISHYFATGEQTPKLGNGSAFSAPTETFETADRPINICVMTDKHWTAICVALDAPDWLSDIRFAGNAARMSNRWQLNRLIADRLLGHPAAHWIDVLGKAGVPVGPVMTYAELFDDPQVHHNGLCSTVSDAAGRTVPTIAPPVRYGATPASLRSPPPLLGEHGQEILAEAGFASDEISTAIADGLVVAGQNSAAA